MMRWRCRPYQPWLVDQADGVLDAWQQQRLAQHLTGCAACRADLDAMRDLPEVVRASTVPDPGDTFWLQQRQAISRTIRNLPEPRAGWQVERLRDTLQSSPWRYPIAAAVALLLALFVYRIANRPPESGTISIAAQLAALDTEALLALDELAEAVTPADTLLNYKPQDNEVAFAAIAVGDLVTTDTFVPLPHHTELSDNELERVSDLIGNAG